MTTGKTIALTRRTFVGKVMSLLLNEVSRFAPLPLGSPSSTAARVTPLDKLEEVFLPFTTALSHHAAQYTEQKPKPVNEHEGLSELSGRPVPRPALLLLQDFVL